MFAMGMAKKVLIADTFGVAANRAFANVPMLDTTNALFGSLAYTIQIYFDFSGYCDMAIGLGKMMNFDLPVNFDSPYKALTITEFWDRWHMTLTRFFARYVYIPLGGSRRGAARTYRNIFIVYLISGIWHGANYTYIAWGILQGLGMMFARWKKDWFAKLHPALNWLITFSFVNYSMALFRCRSVTDGITLAKRLLAMDFGPIQEGILNAFYLPEIAFLARNIPQLAFLQWQQNLLIPVFFGGAMVLILGVKNAREHMLAFRPTFKNFVLTLVLLVWCILSFSGVSTFLYFNF